jgi:hypothetical protein
VSNLFDRTNYPEGVPDQLVIGDYWRWKRTDLTDYATADYSMSYAMRLYGTGSTEIEITATESGSEYIVEVAAATTATYVSGWYAWQAYITRSSDSERITLNSGRVEILPDRDSLPADPRNHNRVMFEALEALLQGKATKDQIQYSIGDRNLSRMQPSEAQEWYDIYRRRVRDDERAEQVARGQGGGNRIRVRMP